MKEMIFSPVATVINLYRFRYILVQMLRQDLSGRVAGTMGGGLWNVADSVAKLLVYLFVFVYIFKLRIGAGGGYGTPALYILAGLFPWLIISEGIARGSSSLLEGAELIKKSSFPTEILIAKAVFAPFLTHGIVLALLILYRVATGPSASAVLVVPIVVVLVVLQVLFTIGFVLLSATLSVFVRDVLNILQIVLTVWIFLTPIFYHIDMLTGWARWLMVLNPLYPIVATYQSVLLNLYVVQWDLLLLTLLWSFLFFFAGSFVFNRLKYDIPDLL